LEDQHETGFSFHHPETDLDINILPDTFNFEDGSVVNAIECTIPGVWRIKDLDQLQVVTELCNDFNEATSCFKAFVIQEKVAVVSSTSLWYEDTLDTTLYHLIELGLSAFFELHTKIDKELFVE